MRFLVRFWMIILCCGHALAQASDGDLPQKMEEAGSVVADPKTDAGKYINAEIAKYTKIVQFAHIEN